MTWVWNHSPVGGNDLLTLLAIADNAADDGTNAWPSLATLARKTRLEDRSVRRIIRRLEQGQHVLVDVGAGPRGTNRYTVVMTPDNLSPGHDGPRTAPPQPRTPMSPPPGHSSVRRTSLTSIERPRTRSPQGMPSAAQPRRGAALPAAAKAPDRCPLHRGQYAGFCGPCRSEGLEGGQR